MNLNLERKVKFWLGTVSKVLIIALIFFQLAPFVFGDNNKTVKEGQRDTTESKIATPNTSDEQVDTNIGNKDKITNSGKHKLEEIHKPENTFTNNEDVALENKIIAPNTASLYVFNGNSLDTHINQQLEKTLLKGYTIKSGQPNFSKEQLLVGNISAGSNVEMVGVGTVSYNYKEDNAKTTCEVVLDFNAYSVVTGNKVKDLSISVTRYGIGFSEAQARQNAINKIY